MLAACSFPGYSRSHLGLQYSICSCCSPTLILITLGHLTLTCYQYWRPCLLPRVCHLQHAWFKTWRGQSLITANGFKDAYSTSSDVTYVCSLESCWHRMSVPSCLAPFVVAGYFPLPFFFFFNQWYKFVWPKLPSYLLTLIKCAPILLQILDLIFPQP